MKKFLVILMVLAMASFLFVGCVPTPTPTNVGPVFTSTPGSTATVGTVYSYTPTATDADGDTVTFTVAGITGMAISTAGVITWTPTTAQIGAHTVVVTASDGTDATAQTFTLTVSAAVVTDVVIATAAIAGVTAPVRGATPVAAITATTEYTATIAWSPVAATFAASTVYTATITITPKAGYTLTGVTANFFTVAGATATNAVNAGVVTAVFPATGITPVSATPVLTAVNTIAGVSIVDPTSTSTQYMNIAQAGASILVTGTAPSESLVKIYLGDVAVGPAVAETSTAGIWAVSIAKSSLGDDGVKVLTAKVTEVGLAEGAASNAATFTLDTVRPSATTLAATANTGIVLGHADTFGTAITALGTVAVPVQINATTAPSVVTGTWVIEILGISGALGNVKITSPAGAATTYTEVEGSQVFPENAPIPGIPFTLVSTLSAGLRSEIACSATVAPIADRARVLFSEEITNASAITAANYAFTVAGLANGDTPLSYADKYMYFSPFGTALVQGQVLLCSVNGVIDLAGNTQTTASVITATVAAASATALAP